MVMINDSLGRQQECRLLTIAAAPQPLTMEMFWNILAIGYDGIRRAILYSLPDEAAAMEKLKEIYPEYSEKMKKEYPDYK